MTFDRNKLLVNPLFYDALSGEFTPPPAEQHQKHTLGRLAYACYAKGEHAINASVTPAYLESLYVPFWAGRITVRADFDFNERDDFPPTLYGVLLTDIADRTLYVANQDPGVHVGTENEDLNLPLELGESLRRARTAVTCAAQGFFDNAALL